MNVCTYFGLITLIYPIVYAVKITHGVDQEIEIVTLTIDFYSLPRDQKWGQKKNDMSKRKEINQTIAPQEWRQSISRRPQR